MTLPLPWWAFLIAFMWCAGLFMGFALCLAAKRGDEPWASGREDKRTPDQGWRKAI